MKSRKILLGDQGGRVVTIMSAAGQYDLKVTASGFRTFTQTHLVVPANTVGRSERQSHVPIKERANVAFRAEFFNLPNTSHFNGPDTGVTDPNFMRITSSFGEREIRFGLRLGF